MALATAEVDVIADTSRFERDLRSKLKRSATAAQRQFATAFSKIKAPTQRITQQYSRAGSTAGRQFARSFSRSAGNITVRSGGLTRTLTTRLEKEGSRSGARFGSALLKGLAAPLAGVGKLVATALSSITDIGGGGGAKLFSGLTVAAGAAAAAVAPLAGFLAAIPAAVAGAAGSITTLAVAFQGMGDAISAGWSGEMDKFNKQLRALAPSAQQVARGIVGLKPAFDSLRQSVQGAFFRPLVGQIGQLSSVITGPIQAGMSNLANALGQAAREVVRFITSAQGSQAIRAVFDGLASSVRQVLPAIQPLLQGFTDLAAVAAGKLGGLGTIFANFGRWMSEIARNGQAAAWIDAAAHAAQQLGAAISAIMPGIAAFGGVLGRVGETTRSALIPAFAAIGQSVQAVAPVLNQVARVFGNVLQAVLPPVAALLVGIARTVGAVLGPAFAVLGPIITRVANALGPVLSQAVATLTPQLIKLGNQVGGFLANAFRILGPIIGALLPIVVGTFQNIVTAIQGALKFISGIIQFFAGVFTGNWRKAWNGLQMTAAGALQFIWNAVQVWLVGRVLNLFRVFGKFLGGIWQRVWTRVSKITQAGVNRVVNWVRSLRNRVIGFFAGAGKWLVKAGKAILRGLWNGLKSVWSGISGWLGSIAGRIARIKGPLSYDRRLLVPHGRGIMRGFHSGLRSGFPPVRRSLRGLTGQIPHIAHQSAPAVPAGQWPRRGGAGHSTHNQRTVHVNAPINLHTNMSNPHLVARRAANQVARLAQA